MNKMKDLEKEVLGLPADERERLAGRIWELLETERNGSRRRAQAARGLSPTDLELWKFSEERSERLSAQLWSIGLWLMTILGALLAAPFGLKFAKVTTSFPFIELDARIGTGVVAVLGGLFCAYFYFALHDIRNHIESNWRKAGQLLEGSWHSNWSGRKNHGWNTMRFAGLLALLGFATLLAASVYL